MLFLKTNCFLKAKILIGYVEEYCYYIKQAKPYLCTLKSTNYTTCTSKEKKGLLILSCYHGHKLIPNDSVNIETDLNPMHLLIFNRKFCAKTLSKDPNVFGDISYEKYERVEMDKDEEAEEMLADKGPIPKWQKFTYKEYCKAIKSHMDKKDLELALNVLDVMKENGDKPTLYIYKLLISGFAKQGDIRQCFKLFKKIRDRGFTPPPSIYNSLMNVCAESSNTEEALRRLKMLREHMYERQIDLNEIHYTTLIKAYSWHKDVTTAFQLADEAKERGMCSPAIIATLFHAAIGDVESGLKHALCLWHKMRVLRMKPTIAHYNLLFKAIKETNFGNLKVCDTLMPGSAETQIQLSHTERPDLLDIPPVLNVSVVPMLEEPNSNVSNESSSSEICTPNTNVPSSQSLNDIEKENRLILFGGIDKLLSRMNNDGVTPNVKTVTLLLHILPNTLQAEEHFLKYIKKHNLQVDITFFNILMKRRCLRKQYERAKEVLNEIQAHHLTPNIITFGIMALGCIRHHDGIELLEQMDTIGYAPNYVVLETLLSNACYYRNFNYILHLMHYLLEHGIKPSDRILDILNKFDEKILHLLEGGDKYNYKKLNVMKKEYNKFKIRYESLKEKMQSGKRARLI